MMLGDAVSERLARRHTRNLREKAIEIVLLCAALVSVATTVGIVFILVKESLVFPARFLLRFSHRYPMDTAFR